MNRKNRANSCDTKHITRDVRNRQANFDLSDDWIKIGIKLLERAKEYVVWDRETWRIEDGSQ